MSGQGRIFKRCGCRDPRTGRQLGGRCPALRRRDHGTWYFIIPSGAGRQRTRRGGYPTQAAARAALTHLTTGTGVEEPCRLTVGQWLADWLDQAEHRLRPTTVRGYRKHLEQYLVPLLGDEPLAELTTPRIQRAFDAIIHNHVDARRPIGPATLRRIQATLRAALNTAVRAGLLDRNPARLLTLPRAERPWTVVWTDDLVEHWERTGQRPALAVWTPEQTARFLAAIRRHRLYALYHLFALTGLRRGEAAGLMWADLDLDAATLTVQRQLQKRSGGKLEACAPKTAAGQRRLALDHHTLNVLQHHRQRQLAEQTAAGACWTDTGYLFTTPLGRPIPPDYIGHTFQRLLRVHGLPPIRLHDLRHGAATLAIAAGADLKTVQHQLGHQTLATTADTYTNVLPDTARQAAEATARLLHHARRPSRRGNHQRPVSRHPKTRSIRHRRSPRRPDTA